MAEILDYPAGKTRAFCCDTAAGGGRVATRKPRFLQGVSRAVLLCLAVSAAPALAATDRVQVLEATVAEQDKRIARLEALLARQNELLEAASHERQAQAAASPVSVEHPAVVAATPQLSAASAPSSGFSIPGLDISGDVRVREEFNFSDDDARGRRRSVLRARLRAAYKVSDHWSIGAGVATGDPDDPNSTDITLTGFDDDLDIAFDQAWIAYQNGGLTVRAGKFVLPFQRTDMVWDGDVMPEGVAATYSVSLGGGAKFDARGLYFIVDENAAGPDSGMLGGQGVLDLPLRPDLRLTLAGAYYDYHLGSVAGGDGGDFRSNLMQNGRYLSDFKLIDAIAVANWRGLGDRWPVILTGEYVKNLGAAVSSDTGVNVEVSVGRTAQKGDWRLFYTYSQVGVDAVFAAFSNDNLGIATNYRLHGLSVEHMLMNNLALNATFYHYRPLDAAFAAGNEPKDWLDRVRLNLMFSF